MPFPCQRRQSPCTAVIQVHEPRDGNGSAVLVRLIELRTYALRRIADQCHRQCVTALENEHLRAAVDLWRLYFETGRRRGDYLADGTTASGRQCEYAAAPER